MNAQIPLPSFEDIRKILQFWIDQQDKWFYFESGIVLSGSTGDSEVPGLHTSPFPAHASKREDKQYKQTRIVGIVVEVISYPPSLLLENTSVFTVSLNYHLQQLNTKIETVENRAKYGLVFSQITYFEPIENIGEFLKEDKRVKQK
jgi:hypothetical protein